MASKTLLLDLPNELFPFIFQYLRSIDILKTFYDCQSYRIQSLVQSYIKQLDISQESNEWIQVNLSDLFDRYEIIDLRLQMEHLTFITERILSTNIQSIEIMNWDYNFNFSQEIIDQLRLNLKKLLFIFPEQGENTDLATQLFRSDTQLESFILKQCVLCLFDEIETCTRLTHLSVVLEGMSPVFILIKHLPNLRNLKVEILSQECIVQSEPNISGVKPCENLRSVTFTGSIRHFDHFGIFFTTFGSTIESLCLKLHLMFCTVNGTQLEHEFFDKIPRLSSLDLIIFSGANYDEPIEIETFQSFIWQSFNPVVYWFDIHAKQHMIFTLPFKSDRFEYFSNDFISNCVSNRPVTFSFPHVRTLSLISSTPLNQETFLYIQEIFPKVTTIELTSWLVNSCLESDEDDEEEFDRNITFIDKDLLEHMDFKMPSVTKFRINVWFAGVDCKTFRCFLSLFPNLVSLELDIQHPLLHDLLKYKQNDDLLGTMLSQIKQVKITSWDRDDVLTKAELHCLFPAATDVVAPDISNDEE